MSVEGMTREQALNALEVAFATPLEVTYQEHRLSLSPASVELHYDVDQTAANLEEVLSKREEFDDFVAYVLQRPPEAIDVPVAIRYSEERLAGFLTRVANQYNQEPQEPIPLPSSMTIRPGQPGYKLDVETSRRRLAAALVSATQQQVELAVQAEDPPPMDLDILDQLLRSLLEESPGLIPGIFVKDLQTGDELKINAEVAYSGLSVIKIAILEETYRALELPLDPEKTDWVSGTMAASDNYKANLLLSEVIGDGDGYQGAVNLTASMNYLGLKNTFMAAPYDEEEGNFLTIVTPANSRTDVTTDPDPSRQTTSLEVGLLLEMIYQCSRGGGTLMVAYPDDFTSDECDRMIEWMSKNRIDSLIEAGVPVGTRVAHKEGLSGDTHADAALVFSPGGDFVLVVFLHRPQWLEWEESAPLIANVATATYNYFNPQ